MSTPSETEVLARAWIEGWAAGKPEDIPLADGFTHTSPLMGTIRGRENYLARVKPQSAKNTVSLKIISTLGGDEEAAV